MLLERLREDHDIVDIGTGETAAWAENAVQAALDVLDAVAIAHQSYVQVFLASVAIDRELVSILLSYQPLVEEGNRVYSSQVPAIAQRSDQVRLERDGVRILDDDFVQAADVYNSPAFLDQFAVFHNLLPYHEDWEAEWSRLGAVFHFAVAMQLVEGVVDDLLVLAA